LLTGQPFTVQPDWRERTVVLVADPAQWTCLGCRHNRVDYYGHIDKDYPVWYSKLPEGYVLLDEVRIEFPEG